MRHAEARVRTSMVIAAQRMPGLAIIWEMVLIAPASGRSFGHSTSLNPADVCTAWQPDNVDPGKSRRASASGTQQQLYRAVHTEVPAAARSLCRRPASAANAHQGAPSMWM